MHVEPSSIILLEMKETNYISAVHHSNYKTDAFVSSSKCSKRPKQCRHRNRSLAEVLRALAAAKTMKLFAVPNARCTSLYTRHPVRVVWARRYVRVCVHFTTKAYGPKTTKASQRMINCVTSFRGHRSLCAQ